jgi:hypothetical protein
MTKPATIAIILLFLSASCERDRQPESMARDIQPATASQIDQIRVLLEEDVQIRSLYRVPSDRHPTHWYVAGWVYGPNVVDNVAVWLVSEDSGKATQVLAVDTMADACSYAPRETSAEVSWKNTEVRHLEAYVASQQERVDDESP